MFCIFGPNLVILAWTGDELSRGQTLWRMDGRTDGQTDGQGQRQYPEAKTGLGWKHVLITQQTLCNLSYWVIILNSSAPGRPRCHFKTAIFNLVLLIGIFTSSKDNALRRMPWDLTDDKSTLVQVMAWCRRATSHYPSQCWPSSMSPYGVTRPQWVKAYMQQ